MEKDYILEMNNITKRFTGVTALQDVNFRVKKGEIHALMGENGAGKSTLIKILTGIYSKDSGEIIFDGSEINPATALEAQHLGISTIYQELNLIPYLSVAENIYLGREPKRLGFIDWKTIEKNARELLKEHLGLEIDVSKPLVECSTAVVQMTALARAISINAKLVVMDEATSSLEEAEVNILFDNIRKLKENGVAVIFVTHKLDEIYKICDTVTILKDGQFVAERPVDGLTKLDLISSMIGRDASSILAYKKQYHDFSEKEIVCDAIQVGSGPKLLDVSVSIRKGEIVGLSGLLGSGRTEFAKALFGAEPCDAGEIYIKGKKAKFHMPKQAILAGMGYCSEDRKAEGIMPHMTVRENVTMAILPQISKGGIVDEKKVNDIVEKYIELIKIKTPSQLQLIRNLSGGNQQKVILARWLCMSPDLIILDEPTRGIDVGAKAEIEALIQELSNQGVGVLYISTEIEELVRGCDRIIVLREGRNIGELVGEEISQSSLIAAIAHDEAKVSSN